jgi:hypothetical protein
VWIENDIGSPLVFSWKVASTAVDAKRRRVLSLDDVSMPKRKGLTVAVALCVRVASFRICQLTARASDDAHARRARRDVGRFDVSARDGRHHAAAMPR